MIITENTHSRHRSDEEERERERSQLFFCSADSVCNRDLRELERTSVGHMLLLLNPVMKDNLAEKQNGGKKQQLLSSPSLSTRFEIVVCVGSLDNGNIISFFISAVMIDIQQVSTKQCFEISPVRNMSFVATSRLESTFLSLMD